MLRNLFLTALTSLMLVGNLFAGAPTRDDKEKEVKIKTSAICGMCKSRIERNLGFEKGVKEADLDVKTKIVTIKYNPAKTDVAKLKANISKTGYDAEEVAADQASYNKLPGCCKKGSDMEQ
ncbi:MULTISPECIES: heavy-metal-associated domain-containing protein [Spirosoma]|uniref:Heavy-metal-associated domain-containing protein n=1 Tax=Spirosoma liriopis TaxID=2937440 RepID=A0ABT0HPR1_9BACT|nr:MULTISPECIES: heavy metal-associated domain-containing protein [Spirosoma]MCK8493643.1 heavy-metal-associated domain-containing protein [Spirosoma liriopis]UHG93049.1 heavy-metal-associated domain-containing protein [Spirosoma oryzicola]